jgi:hypothetical protein
VYGNAVGFNPSSRLLGGLSKKGAAGQAAYGQAMASAAGLNMDRAQKNQQLGVQQMQQQSELSQADSRNKMNALGNQSQERMQQAGLDSRRRVFNTSMGFNYAGLQKQKQLNFQQSMLQNLMRDL